MGGFVAIPRDTPTMVSGMRDPGQTVSQRIIADVQDEIHMYLPEAAPLTLLTTRIKKSREVTQYSYDWLTKDEYPRFAVVSGAQTSSDTSIELQTGHGGRFAANYVLLNTRTREHILVSSISTDTLTVVRGIGGIQEAMNDGDNLVFTRMVAADGASIGTLKSVQETRDFNYTEIIRTPFGFTGRQENTDLYGGKDPMTERKWQAIEHSKSIEYMLLFGKRHTRTASSGFLQTFSGGAEFFIRSNVWDLNGVSLSERAFDEFLEQAMRWGRGGHLGGSATKYLFASARLMTIIHQWAKDRIEYRPLDDQIGIKVGKYVTTHGTIMLIHDPLLINDHAAYAFLLDLNHVRRTHHQGRNTKLLTGREANDVDGMQEEYLSDVGAQFELEASHAMIKGIPI